VRDEEESLILRRVDERVLAEERHLVPERGRPVSCIEERELRRRERLFARPREGRELGRLNGLTLGGQAQSLEPRRVPAGNVVDDPEVERGCAERGARLRLKVEVRSRAATRRSALRDGLTRLDLLPGNDGDGPAPQVCDDGKERRAVLEHDRVTPGPLEILRSGNVVCDAVVHGDDDACARGEHRLAEAVVVVGRGTAASKRKALVVDELEVEGVPPRTLMRVGAVNSLSHPPRTLHGEHEARRPRQAEPLGEGQRIVEIRLGRCGG
jgi:hypothetical protein